ncbi:MAG: fumarylacetoacetate hydrolase family protein [Burkholderiales bacterium]|nr:fumarylacetoacetate hydrolase family protein [Burkholderiales bacterium]
MKLASFEVGGRASWGVVDGDRAIDMSDLYPTLRAALAADALPQVRDAAAKRSAGVALDGLRFLPVIPDPGKIVCVGLNYEEHRIESERDPTEKPTLFLRLPESQVGHGQPIIAPPESERLDYEGEIAVVIGRRGRRIDAARAWEYIAGYAPYNDGSIRDWQRHTTQWTPGKNFAATGGFGPWMVTRDEIADGEVLTLETRLNGQVMQHATTDMLIFSIPEQIAYISTFTTLEPGDVIVTGTPGGVGARRTPPVWMKPGDRVEIEVSKVGVLVNSIARE